MNEASVVSFSCFLISTLSIVTMVYVVFANVRVFVGGKFETEFIWNYALMLR